MNEKILTTRKNGMLMLLCCLAVILGSVVLLSHL